MKKEAVDASRYILFALFLVAAGFFLLVAPLESPTGMTHKEGHNPPGGGGGGGGGGIITGS